MKKELEEKEERARKSVAEVDEMKRVVEQLRQERDNLKVISIVS